MPRLKQFPEGSRHQINAWVDNDLWQLVVAEAEEKRLTQTQIIEQALTAHLRGKRAGKGGGK